MNNSAHDRHVSSLTDQAGLPADIHQQSRRADDKAWIEVIQQMDSIYTDLVGYQVELEKKNSELEDAQLFINSVISSMSDVLIVCDINGRIQQVNQALTQLLGLDEEQLTGKTLHTLFAREYLPMVSEFPDHIRSGSLIDCEVDLIDSNQNPVPMAVNCSARFDHENRLSGLVITGRPLGELRKAYTALHKAHEELKTAQQHLIQSEKMASLGRLVAGVAHELNNPISFLFGNMHALQGYQKKLHTYIDGIHENIDITQREKLRQELNIDALIDDIGPLVEGSLEGAERVSEIVQNLRRFATPQESSRSEFDLVRVIKRATSWVLKATTQKLEVSSDLPDSFKITSNEGYIHQILVNLLQNAIDAMEIQTDKARLNIALSGDKGKLSIRIHDNGPGILEQDLVKVFDPFFTTKSVGSGTGLGLYISYGLATEQCQGDLSVRNHPDGGAEFTLTLPTGLA